MKINRFERKWVYNKNYLNLINILIRSKFFFQFQFSKRQVNSIYFDNTNLKTARENIDGVNHKTKIRLRWYGNKMLMSEPTLEIKSKKGFECNKETFEFSKMKNYQYLSIINLKKITDQVNEILNLDFELNPVSTTHYTREYLISNNTKIRATIDYNLKSIFLKNYSEFNQIKNYPSKSILEFKYPVNLDQYVRENIKEISLRLSKNSKYVNSLINRPEYLSY